MSALDSNLFIDALGGIFYIALILHATHALYELRNVKNKPKCKITLIAFLVVSILYITQISYDVFLGIHDDGAYRWNIFNYLQAIVALMAVQVMTREHGINMRQKYPRIPSAGIL